ncbi:MAG TPA: amidohydrolase family protein [Verrucomicrobiae bacterium]|nr:amidohydrolase family protein [Verrucomicrobiae bacterium]
MRIHAVLIFLLAAFVLSASSFAADLALIHAKIYPSPTAPPIEDGTILIHDGHIQAVGPAAQIKVPSSKAVTVLDCRGLVVTAGFWNSHIHILTPGLLHAEKLPAEKISAQLDEMLTRWGFTTVFDIASVLSNTNNIRQRIAQGEVRGPRILTVGEPFYPRNGTPIYVKGFLKEQHIPSAEVESAQQAVARVRQQIGDGADGIKIFAGAIVAGGVLPMPADIAKAIVAEAHRAGKPVFAHPSNQAGLEVSINSGVDILAHTAPMSGDWSSDFTARLKAAHMALIPTLTLFDVEAKKIKVSAEENERWIQQVVQELKAYSGAGGEILFGTDVGYIDHFDTTEEFTLMARAGMSFQQILASLTTNPATRFGYANRSGSIAKGMEADLVVLSGDPAKDITNFSKVHQVIRGGKVEYVNLP